MKNAKLHGIVLSVGTVALLWVGLTILDMGFRTAAYMVLALGLVWFFALASLSLYVHIDS